MSRISRFLISLVGICRWRRNPIRKVHAGLHCRLGIGVSRIGRKEKYHGNIWGSDVISVKTQQVDTLQFAESACAELHFRALVLRHAFLPGFRILTPVLLHKALKVSSIGNIGNWKYQSTEQHTMLSVLGHVENCQSSEKQVIKKEF